MTKSLCVVLVCLMSGHVVAQPAPVEVVEPDSQGEADLDTASFDDPEPDPEEPSSTPCAPLDEKPAASSKTKKTAKLAASKVAKMKVGIASIKNWPEFKVTHPVKTIAKIMGRKIKTKVPQSWRRSCKKKVFAELSYPKDLEQQGKDALTSCAKDAAVASVAVAMGTGPASALPTFVGALEACVKARSAKLMDDVDATIDTDKDCSKWKKV